MIRFKQLCYVSSGSIHEFITRQCNGQVQQDISTTHYGIYNNIHACTLQFLMIKLLLLISVYTEVHDLCIMLKVLDLLTSFPLT